jgi:hypothetical protein
MMATTGAHTADDPGRNDPAGEVASTEDRRSGPPRIRFRIGTLLFVIAVLALLLVVIVQQVQLERLRQLVRAQRQQMDAQTAQNARISEIIRVQREMLERDSGGRGSKEDAAAQ